MAKLNNLFHFFQSMWRWLLCSKNGIHKDERQYLMNLIRKLVYIKKETEFNEEYQQFKSNMTVKFLGKYGWGTEGEWAIYILGEVKPSIPITTLSLGYAY